MNKKHIPSFIIECVFVADIILSTAVHGGLLRIIWSILAIFVLGIDLGSELRPKVNRDTLYKLIKETLKESEYGE